MKLLHTSLAENPSLRCFSENARIGGKQSLKLTVQELQQGSALSDHRISMATIYLERALTGGLIIANCVTACNIEGVARLADKIFPNRRPDGAL